VDTAVVVLADSALPVVALRGAVPLAAARGSGLPVVVDIELPAVVGSALLVAVSRVLR